MAKNETLANMLKKMHEFTKRQPELSHLPVCYQTDQEGNGFVPLYQNESNIYYPMPGKISHGYFEADVDCEKNPDVVCINFVAMLATGKPQEMLPVTVGNTVEMLITVCRDTPSLLGFPVCYQVDPEGNGFEMVCQNIYQPTPGKLDGYFFEASTSSDANAVCLNFIPARVEVQA